ncbi:MAG TPA: PKD domain-containing protein [Bacteroidia bacterium]|nr:PKD domain-containing protein [Bacteroidia bacterium]
MKKKAVLFFLLTLSHFLVAQQSVPQTVSNAAYDSLKAAGALSHNQLYLIDGAQNAVPLNAVIQPPIIPATVPTNCNCLQTLDATWSVVPFATYSGPDYRNDDGASPLINLPFNFCFYGVNQTQVYINNNGNISFGSPYYNITTNAFPSAGVPTIAPFFADADTRNPASGLVYYKVTPTAMLVRWEGIGYYSLHVDKVNDMQLIITDGTDPLLPPGSNVSFCYGDMQWTTGDASGGVGGFAGNPAVVGANMGDGVNYIQLGTFDAAGNTYNGPFGPASQVSWLDNKQFFLDVCAAGGGGNLPPIMNSAEVCDTFTICVGDTMNIDAQFLSPENNQVTTASAVATGTGLTVTNSTPGNPAAFTAIFVGMASNVGVNTVTVTGTDNGSPAESTSGNVIIKVIASPTASFTSANVCPGNPVPFNSTSTPAGAPIDYLHWDFGMPLLTNDTANVNPTSYVYNNPGVYQVTLTVVDTMGCKDTAQVNVQVYYLPQVSFSATPTTGCAPLCDTLTDASTVQGSTITAWSWSFGDGGTDNTQNPTHCYNNDGNYSVVLTVTSADGCSYTDSIHNYISVVPGPSAAFTFGPQPASVSNPLIYFTDQSAPVPQEWYWDFGTGATSTSQNPAYAYPDTGTFHVMLVVSGPNGSCPDTVYGDVVISPEMYIWIPNAFSPNGDTRNDFFHPVFNDPSYVQSYHFMVFDRWGNLLFETDDPVKGWDGYYHDMKCEIDTYVYRVYVVGPDLVPQHFIGDVTLIR